MQKARREAERLLKAMGLKIVDQGRSAGGHHWWLLQAPDGRQFKQPLAGGTEAPHFWGNFKSQVRANINAHCTPYKGCSKPAGAGHAGRASVDRQNLDATQWKRNPR